MPSPPNPPLVFVVALGGIGKRQGIPNYGLLPTYNGSHNFVDFYAFELVCLAFSFLVHHPILPSLALVLV